MNESKGYNPFFRDHYEELKLGHFRKKKPRLHTDPCVFREQSQEFTGLLDKRGVEIYEGDIVTRYTVYGDKASHGEVYFSSYSGWMVKIRRGSHPLYIPDGRENETYSINLFGWIEPMSNSTLEVIGNIYENPELTK